MFNYHKIRTLISELQNKKKSVRIQDIADGIPVVKKSLENYRDGKQQPTADVLERIAIYFEKDVNYFFDSFDQIKSNIVSSPAVEYQKTEEHYKELYEMQKEVTEKVKENADLRMENAELRVEVERLKNVIAIGQVANVG